MNNNVGPDHRLIDHGIIRHTCQVVRCSLVLTYMRGHACDGGHWTDGRENTGCGRENDDRECRERSRWVYLAPVFTVGMWVEPALKTSLLFIVGFKPCDELKIIFSARDRIV